MKPTSNSSEIQFYATHFVVEPPPIEGLKKLSFLTATKESLIKQKYFMGLETHRPFSQNDLKPKLDSGSILSIPVPEPIQKGKGLWMDSTKAVYIADIKDPFSDNERKPVFNVASLQSLPIIHGKFRKNVVRVYQTFSHRFEISFHEKIGRSNSVAIPNYRTNVPNELVHAEQ